MAERKWFKGPAALALDAWYSVGEVEANLRDAHDLLQSDRSFEDIVADLGAAGRWDAELFPHPDNDYALQGREFESVARQGYLKAIELALGHAPPVPIKTFWMTDVGNEMVRDARHRRAGARVGQLRWSQGRFPEVRTSRGAPRPGS